MAESTFSFRIDDELKTAFAEVAANREGTAAQLLRVLMEDAVHLERELPEHDRWLGSESEHALGEADGLGTPRLARGSVPSGWQQQQRAAIERQADGHPA